MTDTDFSDVYEAQRQAFDQALPMVPLANIASFDHTSLKGSIKKPLLLIEAAEMEIDQEKKGSNGLVWVKMNYQAHCVMSRATDNVAVEVLNYAALVLKVVNQNRWGLQNVGHPEQLTAYPGNYSNDPKGFESWIVSWWQTVSINFTADPARFEPDEILLSEAPAIGQGNESSYESIEDGFVNTPTP